MASKVKDPGDLAKSIIVPSSHVTVPIGHLRVWQERIQDAFDLGFKAAGGTMIPDNARNVVELALTRAQVDVLANAAEVCVFGTGVREVALSFDRPGEQDSLKQFLETVNIYRSRK